MVIGLDKNVESGITGSYGKSIGLENCGYPL